jgi:hypothetical protein
VRLSVKCDKVCYDLCCDGHNAKSPRRMEIAGIYDLVCLFELGGYVVCLTRRIQDEE